MPNNEESVKKIVEYLEKNLKKGYKIDGLKWALINQKYSKTEIDKAVDIVSARTSKNETEQKENEIKEAIVVEDVELIEEEKGFIGKLLSKFKK